MMTVRCALLLAVVTGMVAGCGQRQSRIDQMANASSPAPSPSPLDRNLLLNGDAETLYQSSKDAPEGWSRVIDAVAMNYGGVPDEWQTSKPGCPDGRERYFRIALAINEPSKSISQRVGISGAEAEIDSGQIECALGGWFGGWVGGDASARLEVDFVKADGTVLGSLATEGPDPNALPKPEAGHAALVKATAAAPLPPGTRRIEARLTAIRPSHKVDTNAVATADCLSIVLRKKEK